MNWIFFAVFAYFLGAVANVLDKFLLGSKRISSPIVYAFYVGLFGLGSFLLAPFGLSFVDLDILIFSLFGGALFLVGITFLYFAIDKSQTGRVIPVVGATVPLVTFVVAAIFGVEKISSTDIVAVSLLVFGGILISFNFPLKFGKGKFFSGFLFSFLAGVFLAISYVAFKKISQSTDFIDWYIWTRLGSTLAAITFFFVPKWRKAILSSFSSAKKNKKAAASTGGIFIVNKVIAGVSTLLFNYSIGIGSVTLVNAMVSLQYVFVLIFVFFLSKKNNKIYQEKLKASDWVQKIFAIIIIATGVALIS